MGGRGRWRCGVLKRDTQNMLETLYLSVCRQRGPNSPPEPINLEEWERVSQAEAEESEKGKMAES